MSRWNPGRRHFLHTALRAAGGAAAGGLLGGAPLLRAADTGPITLFENGTILPVDPAFSEQEALAIAGDRILAVGSQAAVRTAIERAGGGAPRIVDLDGRVVLPGFIEPHVHFALLAAFGDWPDIGPFRHDSAAGALEALRAVAAQTPKGQWIYARQFDPVLQSGPEMLTTKELDTVSTEHPVMVMNASFHLAYANSAALAAAGITADTPDPEGGEFYRDDAGLPNGAMTQRAYFQLLFANPTLVDSLATGIVQSGIAVGASAARLGLTTLCDQATGGLNGPSDFELYQAIAATGKLPVRLRGSVYSDDAEPWDKAGIGFGSGDAQVRMVGWKLVTDGSNQGFTGRQREPYHTADTLGLYYIAPEKLQEIVHDRARRGWPLVMHGNGDAAIDSILSAMDRALGAGIDMRRLRCRIEHCSILHDAQIARIAGLNMGPSFLINHVHYWGQAMRDEVFGPEKVQLLDRCASVEGAGIRWSLHSDAPVSPMGPLHAVRVAVARDLWREPDTVLAPQERVSVEAALRAVTINAAWQCHSEAEIGSLRAGKLADLAILEADPRKVEPTAISDIAVSETWMNGQRVYGT
jgi:predicted amidohydrolase YtcJ